jgi:hypothetical protein
MSKQLLRLNITYQMHISCLITRASLASHQLKLEWQWPCSCLVLAVRRPQSRLLIRRFLTELKQASTQHLIVRIPRDRIIYEINSGPLSQVCAPRIRESKAAPADGTGTRISQPLVPMLQH